MKNREKYREEILSLVRNSGDYIANYCEFTRENVIPNITDCPNGGCAEFSCTWCRAIFSFWLDEEYVEPQKPEVDWSKVPVDTLVRVKDFEGEEWVLRYFKEIDENCEESKYVTWIAGSTSKTAYGFTEYWNHCELVEDEDDSN